MLGIKHGAAWSGSTYAHHNAMLPPLENLNLEHHHISTEIMTSQKLELAKIKPSKKQKPILTPNSGANTGYCVANKMTKYLAGLLEEINL